MSWALRTKAIQISVTFPFTASGNVTTLPASDFDVISGNGCPRIFFPIFSGLVSGWLRAFLSEYSASFEVTCFKLLCSALIKLPPFETRE